MSYSKPDRLNIKVNVSYGLLILATFLLMFFYVPFYKRGFNCSDQSIKFQFRGMIVTTKYLFLLTLFTPLMGIYLFEKYIFRSSTFAQIGPKLSKFFFGFTANLLTTEIFKHSFGRLRPHTYDLCNLTHYCPSGRIFFFFFFYKWSLEYFVFTDTADVYIPTFHCNNEDKVLALNTHFSFYSGHSSLGSYSGTYWILYLHHTLFANFAQFSLKKKIICITVDIILFLVYLFPGFSQWIVCWHFISDVLTGFTAGILYALLTFYFINRDVSQQSTANKS